GKKVISAVAVAGGETCILNSSAGGLSTNGANRKIGRPGGVAMCDKTNQTVGVRGALFGYFLGKQKVTRNAVGKCHFNVA
ncbi:MAG: hypothetical protein ACKO0X_09540, partial [Bacteroidota bacterium]